MKVTGFKQYYVSRSIVYVIQIYVVQDFLTL